MVTMPIGDQIVGNAKDPCRKRQPAIFVGLQPVQRTVEGTRRQIFCVLDIPNAVVDIGVDTIDVTLVELAKSSWLAARSFYEGGLILTCRSKLIDRWRRGASGFRRRDGCAWLIAK